MGFVPARLSRMSADTPEPAEPTDVGPAATLDSGSITNRRVASLLLVAEALLVVAPVFAVSMFVAGAQVVGKSLAVSPLLDVFLQGCAMTAYLLVVLGLLATARGVWRSSRGIAALLWQPIVLLFAVVPFLSYAPLTSKLPSGNWLLVALTGATTVALLLVLRTPRQPRGYRRWPWWTAVTVIFLLLAGFGATNVSFPSVPLSALVSTGGGQAPEVSNSTEMAPPDQNPGMANNPYSSIHNDSWQTDAYFQPAPDPTGSRHYSPVAIAPP